MFNRLEFPLRNPLQEFSCRYESRFAVCQARVHIFWITRYRSPRTLCDSRSGASHHDSETPPEYQSEWLDRSKIRRHKCREISRQDCQGYHSVGPVPLRPRCAPWGKSMTSYCFRHRGMRNSVLTQVAARRTHVENNRLVVVCSARSTGKKATGTTSR